MKNSFSLSLASSSPDWRKQPTDIQQQATSDLGKFGKFLAKQLFEEISPEKVDIRFNDKAQEFEISWLRKPSSEDLTNLNKIVKYRNMASIIQNLGYKARLFEAGKSESFAEGEAIHSTSAQKIIVGSGQEQILQRRIRNLPVVQHHADLIADICPPVRISQYDKNGAEVSLVKSESAVSIEAMARSIEQSNSVVVSSGGAVLERDATGSLFAHLFEIFLAQKIGGGQQAQLVEIAAHSGEQFQAISEGFGANLSLIYGDRSKAFLENQWGSKRVYPLFEDAFSIGSLQKSDSQVSHHHKKFMASFMKECVDRLNAGETGPFYISRNDWRGKKAAGSAMGKADLKIFQDGASYLVQKGGLKIPGGQKLTTQETITNWFLENCVQSQRGLLPKQVVKVAREVAAKNPQSKAPLFLIPEGFKPAGFEKQLERNLADHHDPLKNVASLGLNRKANKLEGEFFKWLTTAQGHQAVTDVSDKMGLGLSDVVDLSENSKENDLKSSSTLGSSVENIRPVNVFSLGHGVLIPSLPMQISFSTQPREEHFQPARDLRGLEPSGYHFGV